MLIDVEVGDKPCRILLLKVKAERKELTQDLR